MVKVPRLELLDGWELALQFSDGSPGGSGSSLADPVRAAAVPAASSPGASAAMLAGASGRAGAGVRVHAADNAASPAMATNPILEDLRTRFLPSGTRHAPPIVAPQAAGRASRRTSRRRRGVRSRAAPSRGSRLGSRAAAVREGESAEPRRW